MSYYTAAASNSGGTAENHASWNGYRGFGSEKESNQFHHDPNGHPQPPLQKRDTTTGQGSGYGSHWQPQQYHPQQPLNQGYPPQQMHPPLPPPQGAGTGGSYANYGGFNQPPQSSSAQMNFWNPTTAATMAAVAGQMAAAGGATTTGAGGYNLNNDAMFDLAGAAGASFLQQSTARMIPGVHTSMITLRTYFAVDNRYVSRKIQKVIFPFMSKQWTRQQKGPSIGHGLLPPFELPISDDNAPDLYLPAMSLITYVLLCAVVYGTAGKFNPEVLPSVTTRCALTQLLEVCAIRCGYYLMQCPVAMLDLVCYTGYKYLGLSINMFFALLLGHFGLGYRGYYVFFAWTATATTVFMFQTMSHNIPHMTAVTGPKRELVVIAFAVSQLASMWFLGQTKFL